MNICLRHIITFFVFILSDFSIYSQNTAIIKGKITDIDGAPVENATIAIFGSALPPSYSDKDGNYSYIVPADKEIKLYFSRTGYEQITETVHLKNGEVLTRNLSMKLSVKSKLPELEVTDKTRNTSISRIPTKNISHIPSPSGDFNTILFTQLGVSSSNELSSAYSVRGGNYDENLVYVNDIEVYRPFLVRSGQQEGLSFVNTDMVSSVLFSAGGFEARYGDKMSSVLDVRYRRPRTFAGTASASVLGGNIHLEGISKDFRFTWLVGSRYKTNQYLLKQLDTKGQYRPSFTDVQFFATYDISEKWELNFLGNYAQNRYNVLPQSRETVFGTVNTALKLKIYFDGKEIDRFQTGMAAISAINRPSKKLTLRYISSVFNSIESETYDILGQYYIDQLETDFGKDDFGKSIGTIGVGGMLDHARNYLNASVYNAEHKGLYDMGKSEILWGGRYQHEFISDIFNEWEMIDSAGYSLPQAPDNRLDLYEVVKSQNTLSSDRLLGYIQYSIDMPLKDTSHIIITTGVRANYWTLNKQTVVSPRATFTYDPNWKRDIIFKVSGGYYYQPPFYREMRDMYGNVNSNLKAQQSIHFVAGSDLNFTAWKRPFKFVSEVYYKQLNDIVPYEIDNVRIRYYALNNASGFARGIDFKINGEFVKGIESWATISFMETKEDIQNDFYYTYFNSNGEKIIPGYTYNKIVTDSVIHTPGLIPRPTDQRVNFSLFFQDYLPKLPDCKMHLNLIYGTPRPFGPPDYNRYRDTLRMPPYRRVDIGFSYEIVKENKPLPGHNPFKFMKSVWISLEIFNLLQVNNTVSYTWVRDVTSRQYAIPNYLTNRQLNLRTIVKF